MTWGLTAGAVLEGLAENWPVATVFVAMLLLWIAWLSRSHLFRMTRDAAAWLWRQIRKQPDLTTINLDTIPWDDFERLIAHLFTTRGFSVQLTRRGGDQGIDVIAENSTHRIGIQCKRYSGTVGNGAVQAAYTGSRFYRCNRTIVVCTSSFTRAAVELAASADVELWDRQRLESELRWM